MSLTALLLFSHPSCHPSLCTAAAMLSTSPLNSAVCHHPWFAYLECHHQRPYLLNPEWCCNFYQGWTQSAACGVCTRAHRAQRCRQRGASRQLGSCVAACVKDSSSSVQPVCSVTALSPGLPTGWESEREGLNLERLDHSCGLQRARPERGTFAQHSAGSGSLGLCPRRANRSTAAPPRRRRLAEGFLISSHRSS